MALKFWWLGLVVLLAMVVVFVWRWAAGGRDVAHPAGQPVARTARLKQLPRYRQLVGIQLRWLLIELVCVGIAGLGAVLVVARPAWVNLDSREMRNRDVMLCLDVSRSMGETDAAVIASYQELVTKLQGERIGFTVFDSSSAMVFPLTDDYTFISEQLEHSLEALKNPLQDPVISSTSVGNRGASLIGDGLASCLLAFDRPEEQRSRTVVFATDNSLYGQPLFSLAEAFDRAADGQVLVYAVVPSWMEAQHRAELESNVRRTGGETLTLNPADARVNLTIARGIENSQRRAIMTLPSARSFDQPWPGAALIAVGVAGILVAGRRLRP